MSLFTKTLPLLAGIGLLAACTTAGNTQSAAETLSASYQCGDITVAAAYSNNGRDLTLRIGDDRYALTNVVAASGAKYESSDPDTPIMFWSKADWALLEIGAKSYPDCKRL